MLALMCIHHWENFHIPVLPGVMEDPLSDIIWLNSEIFESFGTGMKHGLTSSRCFVKFRNLLWINHLVDELSLNLIRRDHGPPNKVKCPSKCLEDGPWKVNVAALLDDFFIHKVGNILHGVHLWPVKLERLSGSRVIVHQGFQAFCNIKNLQVG